MSALHLVNTEQREAPSRWELEVSSSKVTVSYAIATVTIIFKSHLHTNLILFV